MAELRAVLGGGRRREGETGALVLGRCEEARRRFWEGLEGACKKRGVRLLDPVLGVGGGCVQRFVVGGEETEKTEKTEKEAGDGGDRPRGEGW